jgi:16S rRNA (guanine966-N2)-methyltransferase
MRIIAGTYRSRPLQAPPGLATRPTSDRLRETLFNVLTPRIAGARFLDLYAGSGAVGLEGLSRGAARVVFVERSQAALKVLRANLERLGIDTGFRVEPQSVAEFLRGPRTGAMEFDVVFLDPPWDAEAEYERTLGLLGESVGDWLAEGTLLIAEHRRKAKLEDAYGALHRTRLLEQGDAALSFYQR